MAIARVRESRRGGGEDERGIPKPDPDYNGRSAS